MYMICMCIYETLTSRQTTTTHLGTCQKQIENGTGKQRSGAEQGTEGCPQALGSRSVTNIDPTFQK